MGWSIFSKARFAGVAQMVEYVLDEWALDGRVLDHQMVGDVLWLAIERNGSRFIVAGLTMPPSSDAGPGYKEVDESEGPVWATCPMRLIRLVPDPKVGFSTKWRARVAAYHATRAQAANNLRGMQVGAQLHLNGRGYTVSERPSKQGRAGVWLLTDEVGNLCYATPATLLEALAGEA